jgi:hypothetical protein
LTLWGPHLMSHFHLHFHQHWTSNLETTYYSRTMSWGWCQVILTRAYY